MNWNPTPLRNLLLLSLLPMAAHGQVVISNVFDGESSDVFYGGLNSANFHDPTIDFGIPPHAGTEVLQSDNGTAGNTLGGLGVEKDLGAAMADTSYVVSFWIGYNMAVQQPTPFSDFTTLYIGGSAGTMTWTSTPTPVTAGVWMHWTGTYHPATSEIGQPFVFKAIFDLQGLHSIAIDGPVEVAVNNPDAVNDLEGPAALLSHPNPANDELLLSAPFLATGDHLITITDALGSVVLSAAHDRTRPISVALLNPGVYLAAITDRGGAIRAATRFVKQ